jgi:hypothetical protein
MTMNEMQNSPAAAKRARQNRWPLALLVFLVLGTGSAAAQNYGYHKPKKRQTKPKASQVESGQLSRGSATPARWSETSRETQDGEVRTRVVEGLSAEGDYQPLLEVEEEIIKQDDRTTRVIRRLYETDNNGRRKVVQQTEEEQVELPDGGSRVRRTFSEPDPNGRFRVTQQETEETRQLGEGKTETQTTMSQPDINGGFRAVRQIHRVEEETAPGVLNVRETDLLPDANRRWEAHQVREQVIRSGENETQIEESLYQLDLNRELSPRERSVSREWTDDEGQQRRTVEVFSKTFGDTGRYGDGRMALDRKIDTTTRTLPDGSQETVQEFSARPRAEPSRPLQVNERLIQFSRPAQGGMVRTETRSETRDVNGRYVTFVDLQTTTKEKKEEAAKEEKTEEEKEEQQQ